MPVHSLQSFPAHPEEAGGVPDGNPSLHKPSCAGGPERVRRHIQRECFDLYGSCQNSTSGFTAEAILHGAAVSAACSCA